MSMWISRTLLITLQKIVDAISVNEHFCLILVREIWCSFIHLIDPSRLGAICRAIGADLFWLQSSFQRGENIIAAQMALLLEIFNVDIPN